MPFPSEEPISGRRFAPKRSSTTMKMTTSSPIPRPPNISQNLLRNPDLGLLMHEPTGGNLLPAAGPSDPGPRDERHKKDAHQGEHVEVQDQRPQGQAHSHQIDAHGPHRCGDRSGEEGPGSAFRGKQVAQLREEPAEDPAQDEHPAHPRNAASARIDQHSPAPPPLFLAAALYPGTGVTCGYS